MRALCCGLEQAKNSAWQRQRRCHRYCGQGTPPLSNACCPGPLTRRGGQVGWPFAGSTRLSGPRPSNAPGSSEMATMPVCKVGQGAVAAVEQGRAVDGELVLTSTSARGAQANRKRSTPPINPSNTAHAHRLQCACFVHRLRSNQPTHATPAHPLKRAPCFVHRACLNEPTHCCSAHLLQRALRPRQRHPALVLGAQQVGGSKVTLLRKSDGRGRLARNKKEKRASTCARVQVRPVLQPAWQQPRQGCSSQGKPHKTCAEAGCQNSLPCSACGGSCGCRNQGSSSAGWGSAAPAPAAPTQSQPGLSACPGRVGLGLQEGRDSAEELEGCRSTSPVLVRRPRTPTGRALACEQGQGSSLDGRQGRKRAGCNRPLTKGGREGAVAISPGTVAGSTAHGTAKPHPRCLVQAS